MKVCVCMNYLVVIKTNKLVLILNCAEVLYVLGVCVRASVCVRACVRACVLGYPAEVLCVLGVCAWLRACVCVRVRLSC